MQYPLLLIFRTP